MAGPRPAGFEDLARAPWRKAHIALLACSTAFFLLSQRPARADDNDQEPRNNFGSVGLIEMPSARMAPDGEFSFGASFLRHNQHYNFSFQALPWLDADFRYSGLQRYDPAFPVYYDRSIALKARLWDETSIFPAVVLGINDVIGTGIYAGEYLAASKRFGPFDATLGMGWGRLGSTELFKNPLADIIPSFANRNLGLATPGSSNVNALFHGPYAGLFGGLVWHTPLDNLSLLVEYSSDTYSGEQITNSFFPGKNGGNFNPRSQVNAGASYHLGDTILGLAWLYGTTLSGSISFVMDPSTDPFPQHFGDPPMPPVHVRTPAEQQQALNNLIQQRQDQPGTVRFSSSGLNALSDALFAEIVNITDISMRGRTLILSIGAGDPRAACVNVAAMAARYSVDLDSVAVGDGTGKSANCPVQRRGSRALVNASLIQNSGAAAGGLSLTPAALITIDASAPEPPSNQSAIAAIKADAAKQEIGILGISLTDSDAIVYYSNLRYSREDEAVKRLVRILSADAPPNIEKFRLFPTLISVPQGEFDILRGPTERAIAQTGSYSLLADGNTLTDAPLQNPVLAAGLRGSFPAFAWDIFPLFRQELFDPQNPFAVQLLAGADGVAQLLPGLSVVGEAEASVYDNFNVNRISDSVLPHVRTDWTKYFTQGKNGVGQFELDYLTRLAPDVFAQARAGYLESMFAGVGGEVLWRPEGQRWAIDGDVYSVQQRAYDRLSGLINYKVVTGHVTLYYASPWYDINFALRAGQYLAGDHGLTFQMSRRFSTGVELGVFFTKTNVSAARFGEGSFDKGFIIRIPLDWVLPVSTQTTFSTIIRPIQRDGGQTLENDADLYGFLQRAGTASVMAHAQDFTEGE